MIQKSVNFIKEFKDFLNEYKVVGVAIGIVMGLASVALVNALVADLVMPIITFFIPGGAWQTATWTLGSIVISWGHLLAAIINFLVIALVIFMVAKFLLKEEKVSKK